MNQDQSGSFAVEKLRQQLFNFPYQVYHRALAHDFVNHCYCLVLDLQVVFQLFVYDAAIQRLGEYIRIDGVCAGHQVHVEWLVLYLLGTVFTLRLIFRLDLLFLLVQQKYKVLAKLFTSLKNR